MKYAHIENGEVIKFLDKSPAPYATASELRERGVYPVEDIRPELGPGEYYGIPTFEVLATKVKRVFPVITMSLDDYKAHTIMTLKSTNSYKFPPLWKQVNALAGEYSQEKRNEILSAVSVLRSNIDIKEQAIQAASSHSAVSEIGLELE